MHMSVIFEVSIETISSYLHKCERTNIAPVCVILVILA